MSYSKVLTKLILVMSSISGCNATDMNNRSSYVSTNSGACADTSAYIRLATIGREQTFACHPGAVASIIEVDEPERSFDAGYIVLCTCRYTKSESDIQESETE